MSSANRPGLYIVGTPIGNLGDITIRALEVLKAASIIACEDTRISSRLLSHYGIKTKLVAMHDHNEHKVAEELVSRAQAGEIVAVISDAGMPLISDPGYKLLECAYKAGAYVTVVPGPSAVTSAVALSPVPGGRFIFCGFPPTSQSKRREFYSCYVHRPEALVAYESPKRLVASLEDALCIFGDITAVVCREITKMYEEVVSGSITELMQNFSDRPSIKGEIVLILHPSTASSQHTANDTGSLLLEAMKTSSLRDAVEEVSIKTGIPRKTVYKMALELQSGKAQED